MNMRSIAIFVITTILFPLGVQAQDPKIGHVDFSALLASLPDYTRAQQSLETFKKDLTGQLQRMQSDLKQKLDDYSRQESR